MTKYNFNNTFGVNNLRIKQALIDAMLPNAAQNILVNNLTNQNFYENVAKQLAASYFPYSAYKGESQQRQDQLNNEGNRISLEITNNKLTDSNGYFNNVNIIPNITLTSTYIQRNFFDSTQDVQDTITIDIPIATVNISYNNSYNQSSPIGYRGSINEDIGSTSFMIDIEGVFVADFIGDDASIPDQNRPNVSNFVKLCTRNKEFNMLNDWLENKAGIKVDNCIVKSFTLPNDPTMKNIQRFTISAETNNIINIL